MSLLVSVAAATSAGTSATTAKSVSATGLFLQLMVGLAVVLVLIWIVARLVRGRVGGSIGKRRSAPLAVLGRQPLGKGVQIAIVKAGADTYVLGVTPHQVSRLARFRPDDQTPVEESSDDLPPASAIPAPPTPVAFRLQSTIRQLQERTTRRG